MKSLSQYSVTETDDSILNQEMAGREAVSAKLTTPSTSLARAKN